MTMVKRATSSAAIRKLFYLSSHALIQLRGVSALVEVVAVDSVPDDPSGNNTGHRNTEGRRAMRELRCGTRWQERILLPAIAPSKAGNINSAH